MCLWLHQGHQVGTCTSLVELHDACSGPSLKHVQVLLAGIPCLQCGDCTTEHDVFSKFTEDALDPTVHVTKKMLNISGSSTDSKGHHLSMVSMWAMSCWLQLWISYCYDTTFQTLGSRSTDLPRWALSPMGHWSPGEHSNESSPQWSPLCKEVLKLRGLLVFHGPT